MAIDYGNAVSSWRVPDRDLLIRILTENFNADGLSTCRYCALLLQAHDVLDRSRSAEYMDVVVDQPVGSRQIEREFLRFRSRGCLGLRLHLAANDRYGFRFGRTTMARIAGYFQIPCEAGFVDRKHHSHHLARDLFWLLVVFVEMVLYMAIAAFHAE